MRAIGFLKAAAAALVFSASLVAQQQCAGCHSQIYAKYQLTGMGRSFFQPAPANMIEDFSGNNGYFHAASGIHYRMTRRDGGYFQTHYQIGLNGEETNAVEERIDYVLGSGNHARSYLHRTEQGTLVQLPLAWYAEKGGYWAMSPGYDAPDQPGSRRPIGYDCMSCHNAYPAGKATRQRFGEQPVFDRELPQGIDCQRCHGPAEKHAVNPKKLSPQRGIEICLQCHLEPDSLNPTLNVKRYGRGWFSFQPGESLADYMLFFDPVKRPDDSGRFQIAGTGYQFLQSACFLKSEGKLQCTTCHDPHESQHGTSAVAQYNAVCVNCHGQPPAHKARLDCTGCHMPKRRTSDVVHVVMTDHFIRRRPPPGDLLAELAENHSTPAKAEGARAFFPATIQEPLYKAVAALRADSSPASALAALQARKPRQADAWFEAGEAQRRSGHARQAIASYRAALAIDPAYVAAWISLGGALRDDHQSQAAADAYRQALRIAPADASIWNALGQTQHDLRQSAEAVHSFEKAAALDSAMPEPHNWLGILNAQGGNATEAEKQFREAIRRQPNYPDAHANLASLLAAGGYPALAVVEFDSAVRGAPRDAAVRMNYANLLNQLRRFDAARDQIEAALKIAPALPGGHGALGNAFEREGRIEDALREYREAVRVEPRSPRAHLDLGAVLLDRGAVGEAIVHLRVASQSTEPGLKTIALQLLSRAHAAAVR